MPTLKLVKESEILPTFKNSYIKSKFDIQKENIQEEFNLDYELPEQWNIGVIVGNSGTGKSTIAESLFGVDKYTYSNDSVIDAIQTNHPIDEITNVFNKVGFSSPQSWLKPYHVLSNGEKMRVDLAQAILGEKDIICFDEFTSVVDRQVAKIASYCIQKYIRKNNKQFVAVSCHYDILDWIEPDWVIDTSQMSFLTGTGAPIKDPQSQLKLKSVPKLNGKDLGNITI